jgi:hypothetical protein
MKSLVCLVSKIYSSGYKVQSTESRLRYIKLIIKLIDFHALGSLFPFKPNLSLLFKNASLERVY